MLGEIGQSVAGAVLIDVAEDALVERLSGRRICRECQTPFHVLFKPFEACPEARCDGEHLYQRDDDKVETVTKRIRVYLEQTMPLVDYYRKAGKLIEIDGTQSVESVTKVLLGALKR